MGLRRYVALMHGLGYHYTDDPNEIEDPSAPPEPAELSSREEVKQFFGGAIRVSTGDEEE